VREPSRRCPVLNFRTGEAYREFLAGFPPELPFGVNVILKWSARLEEDLSTTVARKVPLVITSLGDPTPIVQAVHAYGGRVWSDVISLRHAEKAAKAGVDALIAVSSGREATRGPSARSCSRPGSRPSSGSRSSWRVGLAHGSHLLSALGMGADAGYFGTRFIATTESAASAAYKTALIQAQPEDIEFTSEVTGVGGNFLKSSLEQVRRGGGQGLERRLERWALGGLRGRRGPRWCPRGAHRRGIRGRQAPFALKRGVGQWSV